MHSLSRSPPLVAPPCSAIPPPARSPTLHRRRRLPRVTRRCPTPPERAASPRALLEWEPDAVAPTRCRSVPPDRAASPRATRRLATLSRCLQSASSPHVPPEQEPNAAAPTRLQSAPPDRAASPRGTGEAPRRTSSRSVGRDRCLLPPRVAACATTARRPPPSTTPSFAQIRCPPPASSTSADTCAQPRCPPRRSGLPRSIDRRRPAPRRPRLRTRAALPPSLPHQRGPSFPNIQSLRYVPSFLPPSFAKEPEKKKEEERPKEKEKGKPRVIDKFLEELKFPQEQREKHIQDRDHRHEGHHSDNSTPSSQFDELLDEFDLTGKFPRSFDDGDRQTTNLYVDENFLLRTFARFGTIASGKIMWPRTEEERRRQRNCGFVAFTNRADGQAAKDEMQGVVVYDYELKIGWGKSVALPSQALPAPPGHMAIRNKEVASFVLS